MTSNGQIATAEFFTRAAKATSVEDMLEIIEQYKGEWDTDVPVRWGCVLLEAVLEANAWQVESFGWGSFVAMIKGTRIGSAIQFDGGMVTHHQDYHWLKGPI
ncbi:hypothetical protein [Microbacterium sp. NPDC055455]